MCSMVVIRFPAEAAADEEEEREGEEEPLARKKHLNVHLFVISSSRRQTYFATFCT